MPEVRTLPSPGVTRLQQYYDPLRLLPDPPRLPRRSVLPGHDRSPPMTRITLPTCCSYYPGGPEQVRLPISFPVPRGLHRYPGGSASASLLSGPAQASLTLRPAGSLSHPRWPLSQGSSLLSHPNKPLVSYSIKSVTIEVESSSTGNTRLRGALGKIAIRCVCG
jgi:hypothetical protein